VAAGPAGIATVDVSDPGKPALLEKLDTQGMALALALAGTNAFVADYHGGLQVMGIQSPAQISTISTFDTGLTTRELRVSGDTAYLLSYDTHPAFQAGYEARSRLEIVDVRIQHTLRCWRLTIRPNSSSPWTSWAISCAWGITNLIAVPVRQSGHAAPGRPHAHEPRLRE
jgi:hypothetical protein